MKFMKTKFFFTVFFIILLFFSCKKEEQNNITKISYGTSFGMCIGYCNTKIDIEQTQVTQVSSSWNSEKYPDKSCQKSIPAEKWKELVQCADSAAFTRLDSIYGCPDCADGGAEWLEITTPELKHKVTVEYSGPNRPAVLESLIKKLRELKDTLYSCE
jgi:hypothetical protein